MIYNAEDLWSTIHIWMRLDQDMKKGQWINKTIPKHHIKDKSLDDDVLLRNI